jgi:hypothetical protein
VGAPRRVTVGVDAGEVPLAGPGAALPRALLPAGLQDSPMWAVGARRAQLTCRTGKDSLVSGQLCLDRGIQLSLKR